MDAASPAPDVLRALVDVGAAQLLSRPDVLYDALVWACRRSVPGSKDDTRQLSPPRTDSVVEPVRALQAQVDELHGQVSDLIDFSSTQTQQLHQAKQAISLLSEQQIAGGGGGGGGGATIGGAAGDSDVEARVARLERLHDLLTQRMDVNKQLIDRIQVQRSPPPPASADPGDARLRRAEQRQAATDGRLEVSERRSEELSRAVEEGRRATGSAALDAQRVGAELRAAQEELQALERAFAQAQALQAAQLTPHQAVDEAAEDVRREMRRMEKRVLACVEDVARRARSEEDIAAERAVIRAEFARSDEDAAAERAVLRAEVVAAVRRVEAAAQEASTAAQSHKASPDLVIRRLDARLDELQSRKVEYGDLNGLFARHVRECAVAWGDEVENLYRIFHLAKEDVRWAVAGTPRDRAALLLAAPGLSDLAAQLRELSGRPSPPPGTAAAPLAVLPPPPSHPPAQQPAQPPPYAVRESEGWSPPRHRVSDPGAARVQPSPPPPPPAAAGDRALVLAPPRPPPSPAPPDGGGGAAGGDAALEPLVLGAEVADGEVQGMGVRVTAVAPGGPAAACGLQVGDRVVAVAGAATDAKAAFAAACARALPQGRGSVALIRVPAGGGAPPESVTVQVAAPSVWHV